MSKKWIITAVFLLALAGGSYALFLFLQPQPLPEQILYGNGHVEGTEVRVASEVGGRIVANNIVEGTTVSSGEIIARVDESDLVLQRQRVDANIEALQRERERVDLALQVWRHHRVTAASDLARYRELLERGAVTPQRVEQEENAFQEARGQAAEREAELAAVEARIQAAQKERALVKNQIDKTGITAPINGTVLAKAVEIGEFVQPGQTVTVLVDLSRVELKIFVPESDIGKVTLGAPARVRVDAFPERLFAARVSRVDQQAQFTPRDIHMPEERVRIVFGVTLSLENSDGFLKPGMPADAWVLWKSDAEWPEALTVPG